MSFILDGARIRDQIKHECLPRVARVMEKLGRPPGLSVLLAGEDPASQIYVASKTKTSRELGMISETITPAAGVTTEELVGIVEGLNAREDVDGILVQLPLPPGVDSARVLGAVDPRKDVDGFHPCNVGALATGRPGPRSCTPAGIMEMLRRNKIEIAGKRAVVVGRSDIVGKPMALMLLAANATVTICHSKTRDLAAVCREGDILVAAAGRAGMITREHIRPGATVIDVGINRITDAAEAERLFARDPGRMAKFREKGSVLIGDVNALDMEEFAGAYTPVPGGVGPLTIAMLMVNTIEAAERKC